MINRWVAFVIGAGVTLSLSAQEWTHVLPPDLYRALNLNQRAAVDKALDLYQKGDQGKDRKQQQFHKSAANDWERFRVQHGEDLDPSVFAYSLFMQAMSQDRASDRHTAVKTFTEVLDFFPDEVWLAAPSLYFRAMTHLQIGDQRKGLADMQEMLKDEDYRMHPLAADAYLRVAENHWDNRRTREASDMWAIVAEGFANSNREAAWKAKQRLRDWLIVQGDLQGALAWFLERESKGTEEEKKVAAATKLHEHAQRGFERDFKGWYFEKMFEGKKAEGNRQLRINQFRDWFFEQEALFAQTGRLWEYYLLQFEDFRRNDSNQLKTLIPKLSALLRKTSDESRPRRAKELVNRLAGIGEYDLALSLLEFYPTPVSRLWQTFNIEERRKRYEDADRVLEQLLAQSDAAVVVEARRERAKLYHHRMGKYEEAIKLYFEINDPPDTLWSIVDCQRRNKQKAEAQNTLTEIASIFPDQAPRAIFAKAEFFRVDGEKKTAIGLYRNILSHPEWRKTGEASKAHDRLEDLGIATGGAVIHEVN